MPAEKYEAHIFRWWMHNFFKEDKDEATAVPPEGTADTTKEDQGRRPKRPRDGGQ